MDYLGPYSQPFLCVFQAVVFSALLHHLKVFLPPNFGMKKKERWAVPHLEKKSLHLLVDFISELVCELLEGRNVYDFNIPQVG